MSGDGTRHPTDALAEYAAGVLEAPEQATVETHLIACPSCRTALRGWTAVAAATVAPVDAPPSSAPVVRAVLTRAALAPQAPPVRRRGIRFAAQLLRAELRLVHPSVWLASMLVMVCAVAAVAVGGHGAGATVLSLVAPLVAIAGVAGVYGPQRDPAFEALAITVTSPRLVLLARVTLIFGYDLALAVAASAVLRLAAPQVGLVDLVVAWLGPMTLLSALSLVLAVLAVDGAIRLDQPDQSTALVLQSLLELALPLAAGMGAANLVGRDPAVELQLTLPTAYRSTILRRLLVTAGWVALVALTTAAFMVASGWWHRWPEAHPALAGQLTWLAPTLCLTGLGLLAGALSGSPAVASIVVASLWVFEYAAVGQLQEHRWSRRLTLLAAGVAMTAAGWLLLRRPSRLLTKEAE